MVDLNKYQRAIIVTGDGDFACLASYLRKSDKLECVLVPNMNKFSALLKKAAQKHIAFMNDLKNKLAYK